MAQPTPYTRQFNFSDFQTSSPSDPLPATQVENELNTILSNLSGINTNIGLIQRDDGKLKNQSVHKSSFDTDSLALMGLSGFTVKGNWSGGTSYVVGDIVDYNSATYLATTGFTADSAFANDLNAGNWILLANAALANVGTSVDKFEGNGSTTQFNLTQTYTSTTEIMVFVNGALKNPTDDYTIAGSPSTLTLSSPPSAPSVSGNENVIVFGTSVTVMSAKQAAETASSNASGFATNSATSATKSENYAVKVDGAVPSTTDHSAKAWAIGGTGVTNTASKGASKEWATETSGTVDTSEYSAKEYAQGTQASTGGSAKSWAQDADQVNGAGTNDRSAKAWAQGSSMTGATLGGSAKDWAQHTGGTVDGTNYSAKYWATQANVGIVAGLQSEINTLAPIATDITDVASDASDIGAVAGKITEIGRLGTTQAVADLLALGTPTNVQNMANLNATNVITHMANLNATDVISNINALNATGVIADIGTVAGISSNITDVKNNETNINAVKNNETNINAVANINSDVTTVAGVASTITANLTAIQNASANATAVANTYDQFDDRYLGVKSSDPSVDNDGNALVAGALYFSNSTNTMKVYDGGSWISATSAGTTSLNIFKYVVSGSTQSTFSGSDSNNATLTYTVANIIVTLNGVVLDASDYTASNGTSIVLGTNAVTNDELVVYAFKSFEVANALSLATGGTVAGNTTFTGTLTGTGTVNSTGNFNVNTNKFNVTASSGNTAIAGNLDVSGTVTSTGNFDVNINKFNVTASNGNTSIAGTTTLNDDVNFPSTNASGYNLTWDSSEGHLIFNDSAKAYFGTDKDMQITSTHVFGRIMAESYFLQIANSREDGDIWLQSDDGSGGLHTYVKIDGGLGEVIFDPPTKVTHMTDVTFDSSSGSEYDVTWDRSESKFIFGDNTKLTFGAGDDLQIYHTPGTGSFIDEANDGDLFIRSSRVTIHKYTGETMINAAADSGVSLYHNDSKKLETVSGGVEIYNGSSGSTPSLTLKDMNSGVVSGDIGGGLYFYTNDGNGQGNNLAIRSIYENSSGGAGLSFEVGTGSSRTERVRINTNGQMQFKVNSSDRTALYFMDSGNSNYAVSGYETATYNGGTNMWYTQNSTHFGIKTGGSMGFFMKHDTRQVTISNNGQNYPGDTVRQLTIGYNLGGNKGGIYMPTYSYYNDVSFKIVNNDTHNGRTSDDILFHRNGSRHGGIRIIGASGVSYQSISDYREKTDEKPIEDAIGTIKKLKPYNFKWKKSGIRQDGFFAHEVDEILDYAVSGEKDATKTYEGVVLNKDGNMIASEITKEDFDKRLIDKDDEEASPIGETTYPEGSTWKETYEDIEPQQMDPAKLVPMLTACLQEAIAKIETLETKVKALEGA